ncbi:dihydrolipoyl dehydrogenase [Rhodococcoides kyotonense]|uniref:Dihydrolipoyl dehydrogenase n=1 Tax=Rhodococcoides kyotonense TaxID=398843 RepID=A0A239FID2_9NOCA|nr:dihydrolipoyl dehydrogenase [Rhodococcus kyotonensis]SNS56555.1 dihydrolipoamide dehydrogenase [Rhodococcus kyotonensis]
MTPDVVVLGGGSGGYSCAFRAAELGLSVVLIEQDKVGGTCLHRGCIPTKALLHAAEVADSARHSASVGIETSFDGVDMAGVHAYKDGVVAKLYKGLQGLVKANKVELISGTGRYVGDSTVEVDGRRIVGKSVVLATGSYPKVLPGIELGPRVLTSDQALILDRLPTRAIVLGGGVIGVEFASVWASFGADVTIVEALPRLIAAEDEWSSKQLSKAFRKRGITAKTSSPFAGVKETPDGVTVTLESGETLDADVVLVAVGRGANTGALGDIALDGGFVAVDTALRTSEEGVYAVGDIVRGPQLAHRGTQQGIFVAEQIAGLEPKAVRDENIPRVTYSNPEIASVGLTEAQAVEQCGSAETAVHDLAGNAKSQILGTSGGVKLVRAGGAVVGIHMVGARVGELIGEAQLVVNWGAYPEEVAHLVHAHPTQSEALGEAHIALAHVHENT